VLNALDAVAAQVELVPRDVRSRYENLHEEAERGAARAQMHAALTRGVTAATLPIDDTTRQSWTPAKPIAGPDAPTEIGAISADAATEIGSTVEELPTIAAAASAASGEAAALPEAGRAVPEANAAAPSSAMREGIAVEKPKPPLALVSETKRGAAAHAQSSNPKLVIGAIAAVLILIVAIAGLRHRKPESSAAAAPAEGYIEVVLQPWGTVKSLQAADGKSTTIGESTPYLVHAPPGEYSITVAGPTGEEQTDRISVGANQRVQYQHTFEVVDATKIVSSY